MAKKKNQNTDTQAGQSEEQNQNTDTQAGQSEVSDSNEPTPKKAKVIESEYLDQEQLIVFGEAVKSTGQMEVAVCGFDNLAGHLEGLGYKIVEPSDAKVLCTNNPDDVNKIVGYGYLISNVGIPAPQGFTYISLTGGYAHTIRKVV